MTTPKKKTCSKCGKKRILCPEALCSTCCSRKIKPAKRKKK